VMFVVKIPDSGGLFEFCDSAKLGAAAWPAPVYSITDDTDPYALVATN
jgi:hypothetical protein